MIKNKSLHELIHSLSSSEKRAFKLYASRNTKGSENNYVRLFSLFEKVKPFDDNKIKKLVEKAPFIKYFSAEKNYLYNLLLDCLDIYHRETSIERQISKMINTGRVLMEKKLNAQGAAILQNAKTVSESNERIENIGPINNLLKINDFGREEISFDRINKYHKEEQAILNQLIEKQKYQHAWEKFLLHRRIYGLASDSKAADYLVKEFSHVKEPIPKDFPSFGIEVYYLVSRLEYCRITRNNEEGSIVANKLLATMEKNQKKIAGEFKELYIYVLYVLAVSRYYKTLEEAYIFLDKLKNIDSFIISPVTKKEQANCFEFYYTALTDLWLESKNYNIIHTEIVEFNKLFSIYETYMTPTLIMTIQFNITCIYFGAGEYKEALKWINKIRNSNSNFREDLFYELRTLNMIIHLELGNEDILPSLIKSAKYYHAKIRRKDLLQKMLISSIEKILKSTTKSEKKAIYLELKQGFISLENDSKENRIFKDVDLISWVDGKCC